MAIANIFSNVFARSPVEGIKDHIAEVHECASLLSPFFESIFSENWQEAESLQQKIKKLEQSADDKKRHIRLSLPKSIFLPVPRADLLKVVSAQDKIANCAKDIAGITLGRKIIFPNEIKKALVHYLEIGINSTEQALIAMNEIDALIETGFRGPEAEIVEGMINRLESIESESDNRQVEIRQMLFDIEATIPPINVMFMYKVIDKIGDLADKAADVGSHLEQMLAQ